MILRCWLSLKNNETKQEDKQWQFLLQELKRKLKFISMRRSATDAESVSQFAKISVCRWRIKRLHLPGTQYLAALAVVIVWPFARREPLKFMDGNYHLTICSTYQKKKQLQ